MCGHETNPCRCLHSQTRSQNLFSWKGDSPRDPSPHCAPALGCARPGEGLHFSGRFTSETSEGL